MASFTRKHMMLAMVAFLAANVFLAARFAEIEKSQQKVAAGIAEAKSLDIKSKILEVAVRTSDYGRMQELAGDSISGIRPVTEEKINISAYEEKTGKKGNLTILNQGNSTGTIGAWQVDGWAFYFFNDTAYPGHKDIFVLHPKNEYTPSTLSRNFTLPQSDALALVAEYADVANYVSLQNCPTLDTSIQIWLTDQASNTRIFTDTVGTDWKTAVLNATPYAGKNLQLSVRAYSGGDTNWCGEFLGIDRLFFGTFKVSGFSQQASAIAEAP